MEQSWSEETSMSTAEQGKLLALENYPYTQDSIISIRSHHFL